ncbi:S-M checkpoint control rad4 [Lecanosticta acicola]|uniref:S-M checkpoint control rad4 n=1 Tax=Lecanosticta acicola TaxID=111012 RepID=A0AAI9E7B1_9PEZI|nr:S-M checkpoint control rad4 [Lecanosticta acicola]
MAASADPDNHPLKGVVLCCTSLAQDARVGNSTLEKTKFKTYSDILLQTKLAQVAEQMGAVHKLDLTSDVTHLIVGNIATPKYRYVARERPDIRVLNQAFIEAARVAWMSGEAFDVEGLEREYTLPCFWGLQICLTGFDNIEHRKSMEETIIAQGGTYNGDLTKTVSHLVVARPEGKKYVHAKQWGIHLVGLKWYGDSLIRGMALDEALYAPEIPSDQQGIGAFRSIPNHTVLMKRGRDAESNTANEDGGRRKMRKVASMRLDGQSQELWQSIATNEVQVDTTELDAWDNESQTLRDSVSSKPKDTTNEAAIPAETERPSSRQGLFSGHYVLIYGFDATRARKLRQFLEPNGATIVQSSEELEAASGNLLFQTRCLLVPHSAPVEIPSVPPGTVIVTEWWVERCIHYKQNMDPEADSLSTHLANSQVSGFSELRISTTGFTGVDLRQTAEAVKLMGAAYQEKLMPTSSLLVCANDTVVKKEKAYYANKYRIPVVSAQWLWQSLRSKRKAPIEDYRIQLPAFDPNEFVGEPSASSPAPSSNLQLRPSGEAARRTDDYAPPKRLSNTRRRHATTSLPLTASRPATAEAPRRPPPPRTGPFIEEDDENDEPAVLSIDPLPGQQPFPAEFPPPERISQPLREISPNTSQRKTRGTSPDGDLPKKSRVAEDENPAPTSPQKSAKRSPRKDTWAPLQPPVVEDDRTSELAGLLRRVTSNTTTTTTTTTTSETSEAQKRKKRPLGRNLSTTSDHSASPALPCEIPPESLDPADGYRIPSHDEADVPLGTQLGYEAPDAEAHRRQMSMKLGGTMFDEGDARKVRSVGTVRDSSEIVARRAAAAATGAGTRAKSGRRK